MQLKVKELLKERGIKMAELATRINVDQSNLTKSLEGNPTLSRLEDIAKALNVTVRQLLPEDPPSAPAGVLEMDGKRFALVPISSQTTADSNALPDAQKMTPESLQERIYSLAKHCTHDGRTRALFGFIEGFPVVVLYDHFSERYIWLTWDTNGEVSHLDYPIKDYNEEGEEDDGELDEAQLAEIMVRDILNSFEQ